MLIKKLNICQLLTKLNKQGARNHYSTLSEFSVEKKKKKHFKMFWCRLSVLILLSTLVHSTKEESKKGMNTSTLLIREYRNLIGKMGFLVER